MEVASLFLRLSRRDIGPGCAMDLDPDLMSTSKAQDRVEN